MLPQPGCIDVQIYFAGVLAVSFLTDDEDELSLDELDGFDDPDDSDDLEGSDDPDELSLDFDELPFEEAPARLSLR